MQLTEALPNNRPHIRQVRDDGILIGDTLWQQSVMVGSQLAPMAWPCTALDVLNDDLIAPLLAHQPHVVLLGTGARLVFPEPHIRAAFLTRGIGLEVMDNKAAARTFNILADEGRHVLAAFIFSSK